MATEARYVSANLTQPAAKELRTLTASMTAERGSRVTTSNLVLALIRLGHKYQGELLADLNREAGGDER